MSIELIEAGSAKTSDRTPAAIGIDRRGATRFEAVSDRIWLGWWDGEQFRTVGARLLDVSRTGAAVACTEAPPEGDDAWFCVIGPRLSAGARARVVGRGQSADDPTVTRLRLAFQPQCPADVFEIALGMIPDRQAMAPIPDRRMADGAWLSIY